MHELRYQSVLVVLESCQEHLQLRTVFSQKRRELTSSIGHRIFIKPIVIIRKVHTMHVHVLMLKIVNAVAEPETNFFTSLP